MPKFDLLKQFPLKWSVWWVVLPNLGIILMWPVGGPAMGTIMFFTGIMALAISHFSSRLVRTLGITSIYGVLISSYLMKSFNLGVDKFFSTFSFIGEIDLSSSPEYIAAGIVLALSFLSMLFFAPKGEEISGWKIKMLAVAGISLLVNIDTFATASTRGSYKNSAPAGTPIDSAILQNNLAPEAITANNLIVVVVESWGVSTATEDVALFDEVWQPKRWRSRYDMTTGETLYFGSTTNAELRELCGVWADHKDFNFDDSYCLPAKLKDIGFSTTAMHTFSGDFFDRNTWYPKLGFDNIEFSDDLLANGARFCDGVFAGACDHDVPKQLANKLKNSKSKRNFIYWLTVNSHLPVASDKLLQTEKCLIGAKQWRENYELLCRSFSVIKLTGDALTEQIMAKDFPESDILIVGDHMPPFFPRYVRERFDAERVPWIFLKNRNASQQNIRERKLADKIIKTSLPGS